MDSDMRVEEQKRRLNKAYYARMRKQDDKILAVLEKINAPQQPQADLFNNPPYDSKILL